MEVVSTPELDKLKKIQENSQRIGEFLDWLLHEKHYVIAQWEKEIDLLQPAHYDSCGLIEGLLADYYKIDLKKVESEKQAILTAFQKANKEREAQPHFSVNDA